jgi:hypothetical protein
VNITVPQSPCGAEADNASQTPSHYETQHDKTNITLLQKASSVPCPSAVNVEADEAHINTWPDLSVLRSGSGSRFGSGTSRLEAEEIEEAAGGVERQQKEKSVQALTGNQSSGNLQFTEIVLSQDMNPLSQKPKQTRTKEDRSTRLAERRHGRACPKHKSTKKAVFFPLTKLETE